MGCLGQLGRGVIQNLNRLYLQKAEFYITNVCNLNCPGCNSLSNFNFSGGDQKWEDYKDVYATWAKKLTVDDIGIIGGEPLANPDYINWAIGLRGLWPDAVIGIATNGLLLNKTNKELYNVCKDYNISLIVSLHNENTATAIKDSVLEWLAPPVKQLPGLLSEVIEDRYNIHQQQIQEKIKDLCSKYNFIRGDEWPSCESLDDWNNLEQWIRDECLHVHNFTFDVLIPNLENKKVLFIDANGVKVQFHYEWHYLPNTVTLSNGQFKFNNSRPDAAHKICSQNKCHQFYQGKLYKCALSHAFKEFIEQFDVDLSTQDVELINSYTPATLDMEDLQSFIEELENPIPQCKFCPEVLAAEKIFAEPSKKVVFKKIRKPYPIIVDNR